MRCTIGFFMMLVACAALAGCAPPSASAAKVNPDAGPVSEVAGTALQHKEFTARNATELLVPFYEGLSIQQPLAALPEAGLQRLQLAYPGPLSAPFVTWQTGDDNWTAVYCTKLDAFPAQLEIAAGDDKLEISLSCPPTSGVEQLNVHGSWGRWLRRFVSTGK